MDYIPAEAFDELWEKYNKKIYSYFRRQFDEDTAEDLCQQTFLNVWRYLSSYQGNVRKSKALIFSVAKNARNDYLRVFKVMKMNYNFADLYEKDLPVEYNFEESANKRQENSTYKAKHWYKTNFLFHDYVSPNLLQFSM